EVVPAPEEPVTAMTGCLADIGTFLRANAQVGSPNRLSGMAAGEEPSSFKQGGVELELVVVTVVTLDSLHFRAGPEHEAHPLMSALGDDIQDRSMPGAGPASGLLDNEADRVSLVEQAQTSGLGQVLAIARVHEHAPAHENAVCLGH